MKLRGFSYVDVPETCSYFMASFYGFPLNGMK